MKGSVWRDIVPRLSMSDVQLLVEDNDCLGSILRHSNSLKAELFAEAKTLFVAKIERSLDGDQVLFFSPLSKCLNLFL